VLLPLVNIWPQETVPGKSITYEELWQAFANKDQALHVVPFERR
jgi:hypothetical protein